VRIGTPGRPPATYVYPATWQKLTSTSLTAGVTSGHTYCFSVTAVDRYGHVAPWSADRCTTMPVDDSRLTASSGVRRGRSASYWAGTYSLMARTGQTLSLGAVSARTVALVATTCAACGSVDVYVGGVSLGTVSLVSSSTTAHRILNLPTQATRRTGTLVLRAHSSKWAFIDAVAIR
jgi:hypothetical protein